LLLAGLRSANEAHVYRRQYVFEMAMSLSDALIADQEVSRLGLLLLCRASAVPRSARELCEASGLVLWLGKVANGGLNSILEIHNGDGRSGGGGTTARDVESLVENTADVLRALLDLTSLRAVIGGVHSRNRKDVVAEFGIVCREMVFLLERIHVSVHKVERSMQGPNMLQISSSATLAPFATTEAHRQLLKKLVTQVCMATSELTGQLVRNPEKIGAIQRTGVFMCTLAQRRRCLGSENSSQF